MGTNTATLTLTGPQKDVDAIVEYLTWQARRRKMRGYPNVGWDMECVQPPAPQYLPPDSYLQVNVTTTGSTTFGFLLTAKILLPDGRITTQQWNIPNTTNYSLTQFTYRLDEGFLLSLTAQAIAASGQLRGQMYVNVTLQQAQAIGTPITRVLIAGYVTTAAIIGWPETPPESPLAGLGYPSTIVISNPSAGADISYTFAANQRTWIHSITATLTTSSTVDNRTPVFSLVDAGGHTYWSIGSLAAQAASKAAMYNLGEGLALGTDAGGNGTVPLPTDCWMRGAGKFTTTTGLLQAGDQWSNIYIQVDQYAEY